MNINCSLLKSEICLVLPDFAPALIKPLIRQHKKYYDCVDFQRMEKASVTVEQAKRDNCLFVD